MTPTAQHGEIEGAFVTVSAVVVVAHSTQAGIVLDGGRSRIRMEVVGDGEAAEVPPGEIGNPSPPATADPPGGGGPPQQGGYRPPGALGGGGT